MSKKPGVFTKSAHRLLLKRFSGTMKIGWNREFLFDYYCLKFEWKCFFLCVAVILPNNWTSLWYRNSFFFSYSCHQLWIKFFNKNDIHICLDIGVGKRYITKQQSCVNLDLIYCRGMYRGRFKLVKYIIVLLLQIL